MLECSLAIIHFDKYSIHHNHTRNDKHSGIKNFLTRFRNNIKNRTITSNAQTQIQARDHVDKTNSQKKIIGNN